MSGRKAYTCIPCRQKKIKCDRHRICGPCKRKALECVWPSNGVPFEDEATPGPSVTLTSTPRLFVAPSSLWLRTSRYQSRLTVIYLPCSAQSSPATVLQNGANARSARSPRTSRSTSAPAPPVDVPQTVAHAEELDHSILNNPVAGPSLGQSLNDGSRKRRRRTFPFGGDGDDTDGLVIEELMGPLPNRAQSDTLLRIYLERVEWIHHPLHLPTFLAQYNRFWTMDSTRRRETVHSRWLALLYITLALGAHFSDDEVTNDSSLEERLEMACEDALAYSDFLDRPSTETIQTIISLNIYLNNKNRVTAAKSLLGTAIKMAISMGLSRIPDEATLDDPDGVIERELGRRLWWSLVCQDAYTASNSGFTYSINLSHSSTGLFANVEDDDILGGSAYHSNPLEVVTSSTFHICKIQFALVVRGFIDAINAHFPDAAYDDIMALDQRFRQAYNALPPRLRPDLAQPFELSYAGAQRYLVEQRIFMGVTLHNRLMRLHRAYMVRGYDDERYAYSTKVCLESAYALLDLVKQSTQTLCRWWVVLVHVWTSGLILSADLVRGAAEESTRQRQRDGVKKAISLLEPTARSSPVALRGVKVLKACLVSDDSQAESRKRKRGAAAERPSADITPTDFPINSIADLEQLLREAASAQPMPTDVVVPDQSIEFWQSLFQINQWS
ncbi:hypothetical protein IAT40_001011 [Kwoniella sp. CBS 6097]